MTTGRRCGAGRAGVLDRDAGQASVFIVGLVVLAAALVVVVTSVSRVFLVDRSLASAADGAASAGVAAAQPRAARTAEGVLAARFGPGFGYDVEVAGGEVTVTLRAQAVLPLIGSVIDGGGGRVPLTASSTSRALLQR
jgi:hypothetical protein